MKLKYNKTITGVAIVMLGVAVKLSANDECMSDQSTIGPITQVAVCPSCVEISVSPTYQVPRVVDHCTHLDYTGSGPDIITITQTTTPGVCVPQFRAPSACLNQDQYATNCTYTVHQPVNFSSCNCPG